jgi:twitching motility protein PilT
MDSFFDRALSEARQLGASDLHLKPGLPPVLRIAGDLRTLRDVPPLTRDFLHSLAMSLLNDRRRELLERNGDVTVALPTSAGTRQRVHISQRHGGIGIAIRLVPPEPPLLDNLGLPSETRGLLEPGAGLILVASGPGGGKTTTLAAMLDDLGRRHPLHIVTVEDPVEIVLRDRRSVVVQREVGLHAPSNAAALRAATRQDADVLMVSELYDGESAELAIAAAETGQLVLAGLTAPSPDGAVNRLVSLWEPAARPATRVRLAAVLRGVIHQRLVKGPKGKGRTAQAELLLGIALGRSSSAGPSQSREVRNPSEGSEASEAARGDATAQSAGPSVDMDEAPVEEATPED